MVNNTCGECGYMHPPTPPGQCPMAKSMKTEQIKESEKSTKIINMSNEIQQKLLLKFKETEDEGKKEKLCNVLLKFINQVKLK